MQEDQLDLFNPTPPRLPTGECDCPGYDVCPIGMCGCRWLALGTPWRESGDEQTENDRTAIPINISRQAATQDQAARTHEAWGNERA